jgi:phosphoadenosine phosphosulfate reductase
VEVVMPKESFFKLIERKGFPTFRARFCCDKLKEYKICDIAIQGIRRSESVKRAERYKEPQICRIYGSKKNHVQVFLPILDWTDQDVEEFIKERGIKCHPLYYDEQGNFHVERRLGCTGCPLVADRGLADFKANPRFLKAYLRAGKKWWDSHPNVASVRNFRTVYDLFVHNVFYDSYDDFCVAKSGMFGELDCKKFIEDYFGIELE